MKSKECLEQVLELMKENPDLPVVPMVGWDIVADDSYSYWLGKWTRARVDKYLVSEERVHFYSDGIYGDEEELSDLNEIEQVLWHYYDYSLVDSWNDRECIDYYKHLPWQEAIVVYIDRP